MARWIADGSDGFAINGEVVTHTDNEGVDNVFNALWQDGNGVSSGKHYWKIHFPTLVDEASVGLTSQDHFKKGYGCKALKYSGNLSNGSGLLVGNFGPSPTQGDTIGIMAAFEDEGLQVYVDVNGESLGLTFSVPASTFKSVHPMVSFKKSGSATCTKQAEVLDSTIRATTTFSGIEGDWKLIQFMDNGTQLTPRPFTTKISKETTDKYSWHVKVLNHMWTDLSKEDGKWKTTGVCSTLMGGDKESMRFEDSMISLIEQVKFIEVDGSGNLSVKSDTMSSIWTRYDASPRPFVGEPFA